MLIFFNAMLMCIQTMYLLSTLFMLVVCFKCSFLLHGTYILHLNTLIFHIHYTD